MLVAEWVEDCTLIPMFPTVIKKTRYVEETAEHDLGKQIQETRNTVSEYLFELSMRGYWFYLPQEGRGKKRGEKTEARMNEFIQIVEVRNICGSLLGRCHCDNSIFITRESDWSVSLKIQ